MKMLLKRNLLECVTIISCGGCFICIILNYVTNISPITGMWFPLYIILVFILAVSFSFKFIQWLLQMNKPLKYDLEGLLKDYPQFNFLKRLLPHAEKKVKNYELDEGKEYDTNELSVISTVLRTKLVSSWYEAYISQEIGFPFACKQMFDQMIEKTFKICDKIETKEVFIDTCSILTSHLKEYAKALKRHEKSPTTPIETLYKKTHLASSDKNKLRSAEHCTNILRIILKELVPWELWDTPHSELLVRILSKKLDSFIDSTLADPVWINDKLLSIILNEQESKVEDVPKVEAEAVEKEKEDRSETTIESALSTLVTNTTAPILQRDINEELTKPQTLSNGEQIIESIEEARHAEHSSPVLRQRRGRGRNEVKIYDRIIEGSVKTWETDMDLQCISLGQDLLASLDGEIALGRLWGAEAESEAEKQQLWFGEEEALELEAESPSKGSPVKKEHSPKPAELLKDLQSTVHSAKTKIGGLQVPARSLAPNDEAAGMMEGLLDFGIAGLKKGLRFTGLSDDSMDKSPSHGKDKSERNSPPEGVGGVARSKPLPIETKEPIVSSVIQKEDNGVSTVHTLVKQQRVASQDSVPSQPRPIPSLTPVPDSPEPQYEEAEDLSTSIAKLRELLQQSSRSPERGDDICWEGAEETRGRTQHHHHSSRPVDTATLADEYDMNLDRNASSPGQPNNMQRLDKLFQRTVTGVFNSIKTAVGAEGNEAAGEDARLIGEWSYVCTSVELSVAGAVARLVGSRRAFTHVDAALDSLEHIMPPPKKQDIVPEDFEDWCCVYGGGVALAQLAGASGLARSHVAHRLATLLLADLAESLIEAWLDQMTAWLRLQIFAAFENMAAESTPSAPKHIRNYDVQETCDAIMARIPVLYVFGEETLSQAVKLSLSSFGHKQLNKDVIFRVLDLVAVHFKRSAGLRNPSLDAN